MIASALVETTKSLHGALLSTASVTTALGGDRLYDAPPQKSAYPYAVFGAVSGTDWSGSEFRGTQAQWVIDVYSRKRGRLEAIAIAEAIEGAIGGLTLTVPGFTVVSMRVSRVETERLRDGRTFRARITLSAIIEQTD